MLNVRRLRSREGFTLLELIVVILIIGILAAFAVPQYMKSLENNKADDAAALINMVATTNRMYALDHGNTYNVGTLTNACNSTALTCPTGTPNDPCNLVACKYLAPTDFDHKPWVVAAGNNANCLSYGGTLVGCGVRRTTGFNSTSIAPYSSWGYTVDQSGVITAQGGAPTPTQ